MTEENQTPENEADNVEDINMEDVAGEPQDAETAGDEEMSDEDQMAAAMNEAASDEEEDDMAAMMAAMNEGGDNADAGSDDGEDELREMAAAMGMDLDTMDQGDIDSLLGLSDTTVEKEYASIEEEMIHKSASNFERLPMLEVIFDRLLMALTNSLKKHTSATADINIKSIKYLTYGTATSYLPVPGFLSVVNANPWGGSIILGLDVRLLYATLEIMLGGRNAHPARAEGRNFTSIERSIGQNLNKVILEDLGNAFSQLSNVQFEIERNETNPQFATISQANSPCIHTTLEVMLDERPGTIDIIIPYSTIEPIRKMLSKVFFGEKIGGDSIWKEHLDSEIKHSSANLQAIYHEVRIPMKEMLDWKPGHTINLLVPPDHEASIALKGKILCKGAVGQKRNESLAVRVTQVIQQEEA